MCERERAQVWADGCVRSCVHVPPRTSAPVHPHPAVFMFHRHALPRLRRARCKCGQTDLSMGVGWQVLVEFMFHQHALPRLQRALAARGVEGAEERVVLMPKVRR